MPATVYFTLKVPEDLGYLHMPVGVQDRLNDLLDRQDRGSELTGAERREAEGLIDISDLFALLKFRASRMVESSRRDDVK